MQSTGFEHKRGRGILLVFLSIVMLLAVSLTAGAQGNSVFASIRVYAGVDPADQEAIARFANDGFLPIMRASEGFVGYYLLPAGDMLAAVSLFDTSEQAAASTEKARDFVAENMVPLLPNPPRTVEGSVDIAFVEMLHGMGADDVESLYASLRVYDNFATDDLDAFLAMSREGFLPLMRASDGFFGYYLMHDGAGVLAAMSVFDSEASALASNEKARDFVAENMAAFLPEAPSITSGRLDVAALSGIHDGTNLIDGDVFASVRVYDGVDPADQDEIIRLASEGFLPIMRESEGFVGYYLLPAGDMLVAVSFFDSAERASASNEAARDFVTENLAPLLPNPPRTVEGSADIAFVEMLHGMGADDLESLYASLRIYDDFAAEDLDAFLATVEDGFLPLMRASDGFFGYYLMQNAAGVLAAMSIFDSEASALASNEKARDFVAENLAAFLPEAPSITSGRLGVAALADVHMGANLVGAMMAES